MIKTKAPSWLSAQAKRKWRELLSQIGAIKPCEADTLALLCTSWDVYLTALEDVRERGTSILSEANARWFVNPNVNVMNESWKQVCKLSKAFGIAPEPRKTTAAAGDARWAGILDVEQR